MLTLDMVREAQEALRGIARRTPLDRAPKFGENVYIKAENLQLTGAFKLRGAYNKLRSLTEEELRTIGELATKYDTVVIEDLAYLCMDFRKPLGRPFEPPYQATVARYTQNYILLVSGSKIFSYAGQRIAVAALSETLRRRDYPALRRRYNIGRLGDAFVLVFLYAASSGTSHSAQHALAAMFRAAADGELDFVGEASEYARRARLTKEAFLRHGFRIVYDKDLDVAVSDGFF